MKYISTALAFLCLFPVFVLAQQSDSTAYCLVVSGKALINGVVPSDDVTIKLICNNIEIKTETLNSKHNKVLFTLKSNDYYTIKIFKKGYVTRRVNFNTSLPRGVDITPMFKFDFEIELLPYKRKKDNEYYDYPIAIVQYFPERDVFDYNKTYTDIIKSKISSDKIDFKVVKE